MDEKPLCPPLLPCGRYTATDTEGRLSSKLLLLRIQSAARHALRLRVALSCVDGPAQLQEEVLLTQRASAS